MVERAPTEQETARAARALRTPAEFLNVRMVAPDVSFVLYHLARNVTEVQDPDAGTVVHCDSAFALWDCVQSEWRWETSEAPPEYTLGYVASNGHFTLSLDGTGLFVEPSGHPRSQRLYDVATGKLRAPRPGDFAPARAT